MIEYMDSFCPLCDTEVHAFLRSQPAVLSVRGEETQFEEVVAVCPMCGEVIGDSRLEGENLERAYSIYRDRHGIISPAELKKLRMAFGLSLRDFSKLLGFGEQTEYRYERGDIPDSAHNTVMISAFSPEGAQRLLAQNGGKLTAKSIGMVQRYIDAMNAGTCEGVRGDTSLEVLEAAVPSAGNGYRRLDLKRVEALAYLLSIKCRNLFWTKLQKALFFVDMVSYERYSCSLTGLTYAHADSGPVMDRKEVIRAYLAEQGTVMFVTDENDWGEVLIPGNEPVSPFSEDEMGLIDNVANFINTFKYASDLSRFSHTLGCWASVQSGMTIDYSIDNGEVGKAMAKRMKA